MSCSRTQHSYAGDVKPHENTITYRTFGILQEEVSIFRFGFHGEVIIAILQPVLIYQGQVPVYLHTQHRLKIKNLVNVLKF